MITHTISVRRIVINDSDIQHKIVKERKNRGGVRKKESEGRQREEEEACVCVWLPADTNMAFSVLCHSDINQS